MYKGISYSKPLAIATGITVVAILFVWYQCGKSGSRLATETRRQTNQISVKQQTIVNIEKIASDDEVEKMEQRVKLWKTRLVPPGTLDILVRSFGPAWTYNESPVGTDGLVSSDIRYLETSIADWQHIIDSARKIEDISPMCSLREISITSDGSNTTRRFVGIRMTVRYRLLRIPESNGASLSQASINK
jgi:hypothetical protein